MAPSMHCQRLLKLQVAWHKILRPPSHPYQPLHACGRLLQFSLINLPQTTPKCIRGAYPVGTPGVDADRSNLRLEKALYQGNFTSGGAVRGM
jgi:hypothetical protein